MAFVLETRNLSRSFGGINALGEVNLLVEDREIRCLIGPNGAGKSTLFKIVAGQLMPSAGRVFLRGSEITGAPTYKVARLGIGAKTQTPQLFNELTVLENLWLAAFRSNGKKRAPSVAKEFLCELNVTEYEDKIVGSLAHGIRQRVAIAMVLAGYPKLVLLDEPAAGMSDKEVDQIAGIIRRVSRDRTVIVVEHDMRFVRAIATRVTVLHQGSIFKEGDANEVLSSEEVRAIYFGGGRS
jgi:branched-chain amino acid transport system ATP-binding protein/urea transport system ATP-binding protein